MGPGIWPGLHGPDSWFNWPWPLTWVTRPGFLVQVALGPVGFLVFVFPPLRRNDFRYTAILFKPFDNYLFRDSGEASLGTQRYSTAVIKQQQDNNSHATTETQQLATPRCYS